MTHTVIDDDTPGAPDPTAVATAAPGATATAEVTTQAAGDWRDRRRLGHLLFFIIGIVGAVVLLSFYKKPEQWDVINKFLELSDRWVNFILGSITGYALAASGGKR